jgi:hypothetical protein
MSQQRHSQDRRQKQTHPWLNIHGLSGRRRNHRRASDAGNPSFPLDWHDSHLLYITLATLFLCFADAHNTLQLIWDGALETNPLMDAIIHKSVTMFIEVKLGVTAACLLILVSHHRFMALSRIPTRYFIYMAFGFYVGLIGYEIAIWPGPGIPFLLIPVEAGHNAIAAALFT